MGHEKKLERDSSYLYAPKNVKVEESGNWLILHPMDGSADLKYPRPENLVFTKSDTEYKKGELIGCAYSTVSPIHRLSTICKLTRAQLSVGSRYYEKDTVIISSCYCYETGVIHYEETKSGYMTVKIGNFQYDYNPQCMYNFPDGATVKKFDRFCSGTLDMSHVMGSLTDIPTIYALFRKQFYEIEDGDFYSKGYVDDHTIQEELCEMLFCSLIKVDVDPKTEAIKNVSFLGTQGGIMGTNSFYTTLSYGYASRIVSKALKGEIDMADDRMTETVLGLLLNNQLD